MKQFLRHILFFFAGSAMAGSRLKHGVFQHPQAVRQVDLVDMRIQETLVLIPERREVFAAVLLNVRKRRRIVYALAVFESGTCSFFIV